MPKSADARKQPFVRFNIVNNGKNFKIFYRPRGTSAHKNFFIHGLVGPRLDFRNRKIPTITTPTMLVLIYAFFEKSQILGKVGGTLGHIKWSWTELRGTRRMPKTDWRSELRLRRNWWKRLFQTFPQCPGGHCPRALVLRFLASPTLRTSESKLALR